MRLRYHFTKVETGETIVDGSGRDAIEAAERLGITFEDLLDALDDGQVSGTIDRDGRILETWPKAA